MRRPGSTGTRGRVLINKQCARQKPKTKVASPSSRGLDGVVVSGGHWLEEGIRYQGRGAFVCVCARPLAHVDLRDE